MRPGEPEPNDHYRQWLEENIGQQCIDWDWYINSVVSNLIRIDFLRSDDAILFELKWQ
jgi:hypothetical protein